MERVDPSSVRTNHEDDNDNDGLNRLMQMEAVVMDPESGPTECIRALEKACKLFSVNWPEPQADGEWENKVAHLFCFGFAIRCAYAMVKAENVEFIVGLLESVDRLVSEKGCDDSHLFDIVRKLLMRIVHVKLFEITRRTMDMRKSVQLKAHEQAKK